MGRIAVSKMDYARFTAASLFYLAIHNQRDPAGLIVFDDEVRNYIRPSTRQGQLHRLLAGLEQAEPRARTDFMKPMEHFQEFLRRRGIVIVISDFYEAPEVIVKTIEPLRFHGSEVVLFHVLDPKEIRPELKGPSILVDLETEQRLEVIPEYVKGEYRRKMDGHLRADARADAGCGDGLSPAGDGQAAGCGVERVSVHSAGREMMGFLAPWFLAGLAAVGLPVYIHLLRRHVTTPRPVSSLMFFERGTQSSTRHRKLRYLLLFSFADAAGVAAGAGVCESVFAAGVSGASEQVAGGCGRQFVQHARGDAVGGCEARSAGGAGVAEAVAAGAGDGAGRRVAGVDAADGGCGRAARRRWRASSRAIRRGTSASWGAGCGRWRRRCIRRWSCICSAICRTRICRGTLPTW